MFLRAICNLIHDGTSQSIYDRFMPIFMDRHDLPELTAEDVAEGHKQDLEIQDRFNCRALTYWFDDERGVAFCLIEAPDKQSVQKLHNHSHGLIPSNIIKVDNNLVESFLGRIEDPEPATAPGEMPHPLTEPALRTIAAVELRDNFRLKSLVGLDRYYKLLKACNRHITELTTQADGAIVRNNEHTWITSFSSSSNAVQTALAINRSVSELTDDLKKPDLLNPAIGLSAGEPVTEKEHLFEETVQLAQRLCFAAGRSNIITTSSVQHLYKKEEFREITSAQNRLTVLDPGEERFLGHLMDLMEEVWNRDTLKISDISSKLGYSKSQLYRKITTVTGKTPSEFVRVYRLTRAARLIEEKDDNIAQVAYKTGFNNPSYFSKCFYDRFGILPSEYRDLVS